MSTHIFHFVSNSVLPTPLRRSCWPQQKHKSGDTLRRIRDAGSSKHPSMLSRHGPTPKTGRGLPRFSVTATSTRQGKPVGLVVILYIYIYIYSFFANIFFNMRSRLHACRRSSLPALTLTFGPRSATK